MIVPMKKILLLCVEAEKMAALERLRALGVLDVDSATLQTESRDRADAGNELAAFDRALSMLSTHKPLKDAAVAAGNALWDEARGALSAEESLKTQMAEARKAVLELEPWGDFDPKRITALAAKGITVRLGELTGGSAALAALQTAFPAATVLELGSERGRIRLAMVFTEPVAEDASGLPPTVRLPALSLGAARQRVQELEAAIRENDRKLCELAAALPELRQLRALQNARLEFLTARDAMTAHGAIAVLCGYAPARDVAKLEVAAAENGWGIVTEEPGEEDPVPVLVEPPRWARSIMPLFDFLNISPGYREFDVSAVVLVFFAIFVSMIVNDAGYALLVLAGSVAGLTLTPRGSKAAAACKLGALLGLCALTWGALAGSWFGIAAPGMPWLTGERGSAHVELICFSLAVSQLSLGRLYRGMHGNSVRQTIGSLGWIPILVIDFLVVYKLLIVPGGMEALTPWFCGLGAVGLGMLCYGAVDWKSPASIMNFPFSLIGSFTDTLSYVRLYAVGMAGSYMAMSFNGIAATLWEQGWWGILPAVFVALAGHLLNVALTMLSVLVHGLRLNTLEFSNHAELTWTGRAYHPLAAPPEPQNRV